MKMAQRNLSTLRRIGLNIFNLDTANKGVCGANVRKQGGITPTWLNFREVYPRPQLSRLFILVRIILTMRKP